MLTKPQLARFVHSSGVDDPSFAEKEVVLTYLLQLLVERGFIDRVVFKGGTCIRKMLLGNRGLSRRIWILPRVSKCPIPMGRSSHSPRC